MALKHILRKGTAGYKHSKSQENINHLIYMDDIKPFAQNEKRIGNHNTNNLIHLRYRNGNWLRKILYVSSEKWQTIHDRRNLTKKSSNQNARRI